MAWWQYLLLVNVYLVLFYGFYTILLRSETFFNLNRGYLVISSLLSFVIPLIHYEWVSKLFITQRVQHTISVYARPIVIYPSRPIEQHDITVGNLIFCIYAIGAVILVARLVGQLISLKKIINEPDSTSAFSFFKSIRLGSNLENQDIIAEHEKVHASQWHSADVMLIEAIVIINWFNPIVYFYKFGIKHIHEYIADRQALRNGTTKADYALLLLSHTLKTPAHQLVTPFYNHSLLKRRIMMLQKHRSRYMALIKYGLSAPLFLLMLVLSSAAVIKNHAVRFFNDKVQEVMTSPAPAISLKTKPHMRHGILAGNSIEVTDSTAQNERDLAELEANGTRMVVSDPLVMTAEQAPAFRGGMLGFYRFLAANLRYPNTMMRHNVQGRVIIEMTIEKDGSLSDIKSLKDIGYGSAQEAIRVLKLSPKWQPGYENGQPVRMRFTLPIQFNLVSLKTDPDSLSTLSKVTYNVKEDDYTPPVIERIVGNADTVSRRYNMIMANDFDFQSDAVFLVDGKAVPNINSLDPADIKSMKIVTHITKDDAYYARYGARALNGVVIVELYNHH